MSAPVYIAFEGPEGCGKSTQASHLARSLDAVLTRETGGTEIGAQLRSILHDVSITDLDDRAEALMIAADRAQHLATVVRPALAAGRHVVSDRSVYSSLAYQGYGRGLDLEALTALNRWAIDDCWPEFVILLEVPEETIVRRLAQRDLDRFEREDLSFHRRVTDGFRELAAGSPGTWVVVDASPPPAEVDEHIRELVRSHLGI
jgi:dTMP kinase